MTVENSDWFDAVIHSHRQRLGLSCGDPGDEDVERMPATRLLTTLRRITLDGKADGVEAGGGQRLRICEGRSAPLTADYVLRPSAVLSAASRELSLNGFNRQSTAPASMTRERVASSA